MQLLTRSVLLTRILLLFIIMGYTTSSMSSEDRMMGATRTAAAGASISFDMVTKELEIIRTHMLQQEEVETLDADIEQRLNPLLDEDNILIKQSMRKRVIELAQVEKKKSFDNVCNAVQTVRSEIVGTLLEGEISELLFEAFRQMREGWENMRKFSADDDHDTCKLKGVYTIVGCISDLSTTLGPFAGPIGHIVSATVSLITTLLIEDNTGNQMNADYILKRAVKDELEQYRRHELLSDGSAEILDAQLRLDLLQNAMTEHMKLNKASYRSEEQRKLDSLITMNEISSADFLFSSIKIREKLWYFIERSIDPRGSCDQNLSDAEVKEKVEIGAELLLYYIILTHYRNKELIFLADIYKKLGSDTLSYTALKIQAKRKARDAERMKSVFHHPESPLYKFIEKMHQDKRNVIQKLRPEIVEFEGKPIQFYGKNSRGWWLRCKQGNNDDGEPFVYVGKKRKKTDMFHMYEKDVGGKFALYSTTGGGFLIPDNTTSDTANVICKRGYVLDDKYNWSLENGTLYWGGDEKGDGRKILGIEYTNRVSSKRAMVFTNPAKAKINSWAVSEKNLSRHLRGKRKNMTLYETLLVIVRSFLCT